MWVPSSKKFLVFNSVSRSIACYAAQIWGYQRYELLEQLLRFFIKKLYSLPNITPNYMLYVETGADLLLLFTLRLHFNYCLKVLNLPQSGLPRILAVEVIKQKAYWFGSWIRLAEKYDCVFSPSIEDWECWRDQLAALIVRIRTVHRDEVIALARASVRFSHYGQLDLNKKLFSFERHDDNMTYTLQHLRWLFKLRGELLYLNHTPWLERDVQTCSLCNLNAREDIVHFLAVCPILTEFRLRYLGVRTLDVSSMRDYLNALDCHGLINFARSAWRYRFQLVQEFNF